MRARDRLERVARAAAARPVLALLAVAALALAGGALALRLRPSTGVGTFVGSSSSSYRATQEWHRHFGDDSIVILVRESLTDLGETKDLARLTFLEACLAGRVDVAVPQYRAFRPEPAGEGVPYGGRNSPCGKLMAGRYVQVVYGPATFLNQAVVSIEQNLASIEAADARSVAVAERDALAAARSEHLSPAAQRQDAKAAGELKQAENTSQLEQIYLQSGMQGLPAIDNAAFISQIMFDATRGANQPKARFSYLFPTAKSALIQVRLRSSLSEPQQARAISLIRQAVRMPTFRLGYGGTYTVSGAPVVLDDLAAKITSSVGVLLVAALLVMGAVLLLVFRSTLRLLPLAVALAAAGITFGAVSLAGASLTMASIAVLPVLIGLAVDYAIQFQSRIEEARREAGAADAPAAVRRAAIMGAPTIATAALATATGFLVLLLSPVPMVQGFGILLVVGIGVAFACALCVTAAALVLAGRDGGSLGAAVRGAADILRDVRRQARRLIPAGAGRAASSLGRSLATGARAGARRTITAGIARPERVLALGAVLALAGWVADTQTPVQSDVTKLVPSNMRALRDLHTLEKVTGVSGEIDLTIRARDLTQPRVVNWMIGYEQGLLTHFGYVEAHGCARAVLCPALSLPDLFSQGRATTASGSGSGPLTEAGIRTLLAVLPTYFKSAVITSDYRYATVAFGIRLMPLARQDRVINYMQSRLHPPAGVSASLVGLPVLAAQANAALSSSSRRLWTLLAGIVAVGLVLLAVFRDARRAIIPLVPLVLATGWSALILFVIGIPLNPMSATLGALVIAISTEFSVLLAERFRQERAVGHELEAALARTYRSTGAAVIASGLTAIAGFGVLIVSDINMLRDFGLVTLIDLTVSLAGVLFVLPAVLALSGRADALAAPRSALARLAAAARRSRRRPRVA